MWERKFAVIYHWVWMENSKHGMAIVKLTINDDILKGEKVELIEILKQLSDVYAMCAFFTCIAFIAYDWLLNLRDIIIFFFVLGWNK